MPAPTSTPQTEDAQFYRRVLHRLIEVGAEIVESLHDEAKTPKADHRAIAAAFDQVARCIRRCIMLAEKLMQPRITAAQTRQSARSKIIRTVEDTIQRDAGEGPIAESLHGELLDRLDCPDLEDDLTTRPIDDIITDIVRDLGLAHIPGLNHPWARRTPEDLTLLSRRAAAPLPFPRQPPISSASQTGSGAPQWPAAGPPTGPCKIRSTTQ